MATKTINGKKSWVAIVAVPITANGTYPITADLSKIDTIRVSLMLGQTFRQTCVYSIAELNAGLLFPDFMFASTRTYCSVKISGNNIVIADLVMGISGSSLVITGY